MALALWDKVLSEPVRWQLCVGLGQSMEVARRLFAYVVGAHDVGKDGPLHQGQLLTPRADQFVDVLAQLGWPLPPSGWLERARAAVAVRPAVRSFLRHEALSGYVLGRGDAPGWVCAAVAGHHGRYLPDLDSRRLVAEHEGFLTSTQWSDSQQDALAALQVALGSPPWWVSPAGDGAAGPLIPLLTGWMCLADWLASDEAFLRHPHLPLLKDPHGYLGKRLAEAAAHVEEHLGLPVVRRGEFGELFDFGPTKPAQQWAVGAEHGPGLAVVMVPMGEGKTETALWRHAARPDLRDGLVLALPTMATADAMFSRLLEFFGQESGYAHLGHGRAVLNAFYRPSSVDPQGVCDEVPEQDEPVSGLRPGSWFTGRHRVLTAPVGVVTCDQVLAAAVSHKFAPVRLASLAGKHVVLDEVHTYDPYQDRLLARVLGWLGRYRVRVTVLTATLPTRRLRDYLEAYLAGWHGFRDGSGAPCVAGVSAVYPAVSVTTPDGRVEQIALSADRDHRLLLEPHRVPGGPGFTSATVELVRRQHAATPTARVGLVVNQVDRAIAVARALKEHGHEVLLLHARMTYRQRTRATDELLSRAGKGAPGGPLLLVATSIVEASLDIDMDVLFSDLAPMASLLQRSGRQWRHSLPGPQGWRHPPHLAGRAGDPVLHVLVPVDRAGGLHAVAHYPYSRAEILRTWSSPDALASGARTVLHVPGDVQAAVDAADVSLADLHADPVDSADPELSVALAAHQIEATRAASSAQRAGVDAETVGRGWRAAMREDEHDRWAGVPALDALTRGRIWHEEAVTRLRDTDSVQVLIYDPSSTNPHAWPGCLDELLAVRDRPAQLHALDHVIPVSGSLAGRLRRAAAPHTPAHWHPFTLLREVIPLSVGQLPTGCQLTDNGLEQHREG